MPWEASITVKDDKNKISFVKIFIQWFVENVPAYNSFEDAEAAILELLPVIDDMIAGQITNVSISKSIVLPGGLKTTPGTGADVEEKGKFVFQTAYSKPIISLPTFKDSLIVSGTDEIDTSDEDVSLFIFLMTDGSGSALEFVHPSDNRDAEIVNYLRAEERFRKSGKRRN